MRTKITFKGNPLTLVGRVIKEDTPAPDFKVTGQDLREVRLSDFKGKTKIITTFPSIDTPVCDMQVKEFNRRALESAAGEAVIIGISKDLPFAQKRFCEAFEIRNVIVLSDYKSSSFGINYGLLVKELNLLARSVIILDKYDLLRYVQIVGELTNAPDYDEALSRLEAINKNPLSLNTAGDLPLHCKPCEGGIAPLGKEKINKLIAQYRGWELIEDKKLLKEFKFRDFLEAKYFFDMVSVLAEEQGHHPTITIIYNRLKIALTTHAAGGLTENDFIMAKIIDELGDRDE